MSTGPVSGAESTSAIMGSIDLGPHNSIQFLFAKLQLTQAQICKDQAQDYIDKITETQEKQKECADMIAKARELQQQAKNDDTVTAMPDDMKQFFEKYGLDWDKEGKDDWHNSDEWDYNIKSLTNFQDTLGTSTQTDMVYLQDFMSQYNGFLQGANSAIKESNDTLTTILRG